MSSTGLRGKYYVITDKMYVRACREVVGRMSGANQLRCVTKYRRPGNQLDPSHLDAKWNVRIPESVDTDKSQC
jgi:hypothetical protein